MAKFPDGASDEVPGVVSVRNHSRAIFKPRALGVPGVDDSIAVVLRRAFAEAEMDAEERNKANAVVSNIDLNRRISALDEARKMRDAIISLLALLAELDDIASDERDLSSFEEISDLFDDVASFASRGASATRSLSHITDPDRAPVPR